MGQIRIVRPDQLTVRYGHEFLKDVDETTPPGLVDAEERSYFPVDDETIALREYTLGPDVQVRVHAHDADEILYVLEGGLRFGAQVCPPGTAVYVPKHTLYGELAGPEGSRVLLIRGEIDVATIPKADFIAARKKAGVADETASPTSG